MKFSSGKKLFIVIGITFLVSYVCAVLLNSFISNGYRIVFKWSLLWSGKTFLFAVILMSFVLLIYLIYYDKYYWVKHGKKILEGEGEKDDISTNLEMSRWQSDKELRKNFISASFDDLNSVNKIGIPIKAEQVKNDYVITLAKPNHTLVIGTTGSGKTTTFISPSIEILSKLGTKPSLIIADPKGELYKLHAHSLKEKGYEIKVFDLRNPYFSIKWNPLEDIYKTYQEMLYIENKVIRGKCGKVFKFYDEIYQDSLTLDKAIKVKKQMLYDEVYESLNDIITALCPITNDKEPIWESGAKNLIFAIALAMLEDSEKEDNDMTIEKFNFYNITKIATHTDNDCAELKGYFLDRSPLSKAVSLSKQVLECSDKTRGSYMSTVFDKLSMFSDMSLCSLTSKSELDFYDMDESPIALFLKIPDERETRHTLASLMILQAYKTLVKKANSYNNLALSRDVFFLLDEFGNLPKIHKLEQMITVGRSRKIWMILVVQSYMQLQNVYDEKVADIIKSNCNIEIFIGTTDVKTIEEFSKKCGNYTVITKSVGYNLDKVESVNTNHTIKERPLIYPSELAKLNSPNNMGNSIVTIFGYMPIKSKFTPIFNVNVIKLIEEKENMEYSEVFDEEAVYYDISKLAKKKVNKRLIEKKDIPISSSSIKSKLGELIDSTKAQGILDDKDAKKLSGFVSKYDFERIIEFFEWELKKESKANIKEELKMAIESVRVLEKEYFLTKGRYKNVINNNIKGEQCKES